MTKYSLLLICAFLYSQVSYSSIDLYKFTITPNFESKSIVGETSLFFTKGDSSVSLPTNEMVIDQVLVNGKKISFHKMINNQILSITLNPKFKNNILIKYHGKPNLGLVFGKDYVFTDFDNCKWMFCLEDPHIRVPVEFSFIVPREFSIVSNGEMVDSRILHEKKFEQWKQSTPMSSYLYGFAIGKFTQTHDRYGDGDLKFYATEGNEADLFKKLETTKEVLKFYEDKSGVNYPFKKYHQIIVPEDEAQEKDGFALLGKGFIDPILEDPKEDWIIVHELSHQWWGNSLTCLSWKDFWLNEGITTFMTATFKEMKWGKDSYNREIELAKKRYQFAIDSKFDVPLTFDGAYPNLRTKRSIVYSKGFLFLDELRRFLGDDIFWKALKNYTQRYVNKSVTTSDFQKVFEEVSGRSLNDIFIKYVY